MKEMKKAFLCFAMILSVLFLLTAPAAVLATGENTDYSGVYVWDTAGIMTEEEQNALQEKAEQVAADYQCACYIVTVNDYQDYSTASPYDAAKSIWQDMDFGYGDGRDGEMLMLSMNDRDFAIIAHGDFGNMAFTDYGKEKLDEVYLDNFRNNDWYGGFSDYLTQSEKYLQMARDGEPFDVDTDPDAKSARHFMERVIAMIIGLIAGGSVVGGSYRSMKTATEAGNANVYAIRGSLTVDRRRDVFQNRTITHRHIQRNKGSGGGGGGTSVDSSGFSGHSGKF